MTSHRHGEDIDPTSTLRIEDLNDRITAAVNLTSLAFERADDLDRSYRHLIFLVLKSFISAHKSICTLLKKHEEDIVMAADAMSLLREQVEKVFVTALVLDDPSKFVDWYLKDDWRRTYERFLLEAAERGHLPRHEAFFTETIPEYVQHSMREEGITDLQKEAVEYEFEHLGEALPPHLREARIKPFPTPWRVIGLVRDNDVKQFLRRWYREYRFLCGYTHVGMSKLLPVQIADGRLRLPSSTPQAYYQAELLPAAIVSGIAAASACTEASRPIPLNLDLLAKLTDLWEMLRKSALLAKALWELRVRHVLPPSVGGMP